MKQLIKEFPKQDKELIIFSWLIVIAWNVIVGEILPFEQFVGISVAIVLLWFFESTKDEIDDLVKQYPFHATIGERGMKMKKLNQNQTEVLQFIGSEMKSKFDLCKRFGQDRVSPILKALINRNLIYLQNDFKSRKANHELKKIFFSLSPLGKKCLKEFNNVENRNRSL